MRPAQRNTWCEIDLDQFHRNLAALQPADAQMLLVVKANAYGHGLVRMAQEAVKYGVAMLGVGSINEAEQLLDAGIEVPVLVIVPLLADEIAVCVARGVHFMAWRLDQFAAAAKAQDVSGNQPFIHVELDFGMARSGASEKQFGELISVLNERALAMVHGLCAHYAFAAVAPTTDVLQENVDMFLRCAELLKARGVNPVRHVSNSAGTLRFPPGHLDMVRMGAAAYGIVSTKLFDVSDVASRILTWKALVTNVKELQAGQGVNYGWEYVASEDHRVATIGVGYADGYRRHPAGINLVLVGGVNAPVLGRINMDQCVFRVPHGVDVQVGDEVILLGKQGEREITIADLASRWETNGYDVMLGIRDRVPRIFLG